MLGITGTPHRMSDGVSRRGFLRIGALGATGLTLPHLLRAEARAGVGSSNKAVINIFLRGGPSHLDTIDLKPGAPVEIRGQFRPIGTNVPGIQICEHLPRLARIADKLVFIRSIVGSDDKHGPFQCMTGFPEPSPASTGSPPAMGSYVAKLRSSPREAAPAFVAMMNQPVSAGFLGPAYRPYTPIAGGGLGSLSLGTIGADRLTRRQTLLKELDGLRRDMDPSGMMKALDAYHEQALNIITSGKVADALDLSREEPAVRRRYRLERAIKMVNPTEKISEHMDRLLLARRLIEAGVRCVSLFWGDFDTHEDNFNRLKEFLPALDQGLSALVQDLDERGMLGDVSVVAWGEFGRSPRVNGRAGREHWPVVNGAVLAGGGMRTGQVVGATDRLGGEVAERPVHFQQVFATLYHNLGIDPEQTQVVDHAGRPQYLLEHREPIRELI